VVAIMLKIAPSVLKMENSMGETPADNAAKHQTTAKCFSSVVEASRS
jgi:hypothetical protein